MSRTDTDAVPLPPHTDAVPLPPHTDAVPLPAPTAPLPPPHADHLPDDPVILKQMILELLATLQEAHRDREALRQRLDVLLRRLYGPRTERVNPNQPLLFGESPETPEGALAPAPPEDADASQPRRCRPHGRRRLSDYSHLPRRTEHHELSEPERVCAGCGQVRIEIGVESSEQLDFQPAALFVTEHVVHKYACPHCAREPAAGVAIVAPALTDTEPADATGLAPSATLAPEDVAVVPAGVPVVIAAPRPTPPIAKGMPGPGLLAHIIVSKFTDHLPLYRQERILERQGLFVSRSTTCDWLAACAGLLRPLYDLMVAWVLQSRVLHTDDTPVTIQDPAPAATSTGRLWACLGDREHPYNVFDFTPNRKRDGPLKFFATYQGYLQADAFAGYDALYLPSPRSGVASIIEVACNAHARRKFYEARTSDSQRAHQALAYYRELYEIERRATALDADEELRRRMRQDLAVPILDQFHVWLKAQKPDAVPKSPLGEAIGYALNNWAALTRYTEAGFLAIDNNVAEREMKRVAIGRKNWLFVGSEKGGHTAAVLMSFTSTCHRLKIEPWSYLQDVLTRLPRTPTEQLAELLPDRWQAARQAAAAAAAKAVGAESASPPASAS